MEKQQKRTNNSTTITDLFTDLSENPDVYNLISIVRKGIKFSIFNKLVNDGPFTMKDWANYLNLSERTLQRYRKEKKVFEPFQSEKIIRLAILQKKGIELFGDIDKFNQWMEASIVALGGVKPKELLDSSFGVELLKDQLGRIEHGVLA